MLDKMSNYDLGILWGNGALMLNRLRYVMRFTHKERYYIERMQQYSLNANIIERTTLIRGKPYTRYKMQVPIYNPQQLYDIGWDARKAPIRRLPDLSSYSDFLRAYIELHSLLDYSKRTGGSGIKAIKINLRIFGNYQLLDDITRCLADEAGVKPKKVQRHIKDGKRTDSAVLGYASPPEIEQIYNYLTGTPCFEPYWEHVDYMLRHPTKPVE